ncbi:hypothetical protein D1818_03605 [Aquimarina sp. BL5]|uniref:hypothetical protein n=1 Tax=Aquimarina sp. BL5 TaxID=1714860 RepID=UPI000E4DE71E|nr:hypothetical protein [Aquimarina sp. BL5]AXT49954.1 hypothetical protein D1818_03605 [Aquimarina sp. BL5]RKN07459.1 hypothetical protein D7036_07590 [Aquimarina sp. BL5]
MLHSILNLDGVQTLDKKQQQIIKAGGWPRTEEDCYLCGGISWIPNPLNGGLCELSWDSVCL